MNLPGSIRFSIIVPVFNRPEELSVLLQSLKDSDYPKSRVELIIVEDGSQIISKDVLTLFQSLPNLHYLVITNSGPGLARNVGAKLAKGDFLIFLDSDCLVPSNYFNAVEKGLSDDEIDLFGGPERPHVNFSRLQLAITFSMTSPLTTGGIRGNRRNLLPYRPRSYNMGVKRTAFNQVEGFKAMNYGEDIDFSLRMEKAGKKSKLFIEAYVYHFRRNTLPSFARQTYRFGRARPILNNLHKETRSLLFWLPSLFLLCFIAAWAGVFYQSYWILGFFALFACVIFIFGLISGYSWIVAILSILTSFLQLISYGYGFLESWIKLNIFGKDVQETFPAMFSNRNDFT